MPADPEPRGGRGPEVRSVFFLIRSLGIGGAERQLIHLASGLHALGHRVTVGVYYPDVLDEELRAKGVRLVHLDKKGRWDLAFFMLRLVRALRSERPDVLYSFLGTANILAALVRPFAPKLKLVWSVRASNMDVTAYDRVSGLSYKVECRLSRRPDLIISNSRAGADYAAAHGFPRERMTVVPNGIDTDRFRPDAGERQRIRAQWGVSEGELLVGVLARLDPMKDHPNFLRAAAVAAERRPDLRFVCIGSGAPEYERELKALATELGLDRRLIWAGAAKDPVAALNALDLCCSSSAWGEGFSNSVAEAMACGTPCVVTDVGDSALVVGDTGKVVPPGQPEPLADALLEAAEEARPEARERARRRIVDNFSLPRLLENTLAAISGGARA